MNHPKAASTKPIQHRLRPIVTQQQNQPYLLGVVSFFIKPLLTRGLVLVDAKRKLNTGRVRESGVLCTVLHPPRFNFLADTLSLNYLILCDNDAATANATKPNDAEITYLTRANQRCCEHDGIQPVVDHPISLVQNIKVASVTLATIKPRSPLRCCHSLTTKGRAYEGAAGLPLNL